MATAADYQKQLEDMGQMPDFKSMIAQAYDKPVLRPIVGEAANLEGQWLPTIFNTFAQQGTGAADMSPAAKLAMIGQNLGRLGGQISSNQGIQNFYGMQIQDLAGQEMQKYGNRQQQLKDLYGMAFQQEESKRQEEARKASLRAQQAAAAANNMQALLAKYGAGGGNPSIQVGAAQNLNELNAKRALSGKAPLTQDYYNQTYNPPKVGMPSYSDALVSGVQDKWNSPNWSDKALGLISAPGAGVIKGLGSIFGF